MKKSIVTGILAVLSFIMLIVSCAGIYMTDKIAPVINLNGKNTLTYTEGESYDALLENMTAEDDKDGDVTESLRVSNIYVISENKATVVYVAKDQANNIGKLKREVHYQAKAEEAAAQEEKKTVSKKEAETTSSQDNVPPATSSEEPTPVSDTQEENIDAPHITMLQNEVTLKVGESFNISRYIQSAVDKDGTNLSRSVHIDGVYDMNQPGVYEIRVYATNSSGETSNIEIFTLTVEP